MKNGFLKNIVLIVGVFLLTFVVTFFIGQILGIQILNLDNYKYQHLLALPLPTIVTSLFILIKLKKDKVKSLLFFWLTLLILLVLLNFIGITFHLNILNNDIETCEIPTSETTINDYMNINFCPQP